MDNFSIKTKARIAGLFYFLTAITTIFGVLYVTGALIVYRDATVTANNILANESLFRWGIAVNVIGQVLQLCLAIALYKLFKDVSHTLSLAVLASKLVSLTLAVTGQIGAFAALHLLTARELFVGFSVEQLNSLALLALRLTNEMQGLSEVFWWPANLCIGLLIVRSGFIPRLLGYLMIFGSFGFVINVFLKLLVPGFHSGLVTLITIIMGASCGVPIIFWLLIWGIKQPKTAGGYKA